MGSRSAPACAKRSLAGRWMAKGGPWITSCLPAAGRVERLWRTVKYEEIYLRDYESVKDLKHHLRIYFDFCNRICPHQTFEGKTPAEIYWGETKQEKAA